MVVFFYLQIPVYSSWTIGHNFNMKNQERSIALKIMTDAYNQHKISQKCVESVKNQLDMKLSGTWQCVLIQTIPWYTSTSPIKEFEFVFGNMDHIPNMRMKCIRTA